MIYSLTHLSSHSVVAVVRSNGSEGLQNCPSHANIHLILTAGVQRGLLPARKYFKSSLWSQGSGRAASVHGRVGGECNP